MMEKENEFDIVREGIVIEVHAGHGRDETHTYLLLKEEGGTFHGRVDGGNTVIHADDFKVGMRLRYVRFASDHEDPGLPDWAICDIRHPEPMISQTVANWIRWRQGGVLNPALIEMMADAARIADDDHDEDFGVPGLRARGERIVSEISLGRATLDDGYLTIDAIPATTALALKGRLVRDLMDLEFFTDEVITDVVREDEYAEVHFDQRYIPLLSLLAPLDKS